VLLGRYLDVEITLVHGGRMVMPGSGANRPHPGVRTVPAGSQHRRAVDPLAERVGVAVVAGVLLDQVDEDPAQGDGAAPGVVPRDVEVGAPARNRSAKATSARQAAQEAAMVPGSPVAPSGSAGEVRRAGASRPAGTRRNQRRSTSARRRTSPSRDSPDGSAERGASSPPPVRSTSAPAWRAGRPGRRAACAAPRRSRGRRTGGRSPGRRTTRSSCVVRSRAHHGRGGGHRNAGPGYPY
jgi:hypothetical protein